MRVWWVVRDASKGWDVRAGAIADGRGALEGGQAEPGGLCLLRGCRASASIMGVMV
jgi:hypothetical protein